MNKITFPLEPDMNGPQVRDLQDALQLFLDRNIIIIPVGGETPSGWKLTLLAAFNEERIEQIYGSATRQLVEFFQVQRNLEVDGVVNEPTALAMNQLLDELSGSAGGQSEYLVKGTIHYFDGCPATGVDVSAFDRDLRSMQPLGETKSDENGRYYIRYDAEQFARYEKKSADLVVLVYYVKNKEKKLLAQSPTIFNAKIEETIDITINDEYIGPSEYERIIIELDPLLEDMIIEAISEPTLIDKLADLKSNDIEFLAGETEIERSKIEFLNLAAINEKSALERDLNLSAEAFYGIAREGLTIDFEALLLVRDQDLCEALAKAIKDNIIRRNCSDYIDYFIQGMHVLASRLKLPSRKDEVIKLETLSNLSPKELKEEDPKLFLKLRFKAINQLKSSLDSCFQNSSKALRDHIAGLDLAKAIDEDISPGDILRDSLKPPGIRPEIAQEAQERLRELGEFGLPANPLKPNVPLRAQTLTQDSLQQGRVYALGGITGLKDEKIEAVLDKSPNIFSLNDETLTSLVDENKLDEGEAKNFGLAIGIYNIVDGDIGLTKYLKLNNFAKLDDQPVKKANDLAAFNAEDWKSIIESAAIQLPKTRTTDEYAIRLSKRIESIYPTDTFLARIRPMDEKWINERLEKLKPLLKINKSPFKNADFNLLKRGSLKKQNSERLRSEFTQLKKFANVYSSFGIAELLDNVKLSPNDRAREIVRRTGLLTKVQEQNPDYELLALDYSPESPDISSLDLSYLNSDEQYMVLSSLKTFQRIHTITKDAEHAKVILESGYRSAIDIAHGDLKKFVASTGLNEESALDYYKVARSRSIVNANQVASIMDYHKGGFGEVNVGNQQLDIRYYLKKLDGYADLFGSQDFCLCEHCQSIVSPAAYFVDLMYFVEKSVIDEYFAGSKQRHPLNLRRRRPDLWKLQLTCQNTNERIPTLEIINEILENYIARHKGLSEKDLEDKIAVQKAVYASALASDESASSFKLPFLLPLEKLQIYLFHFNRTRADVARLLNKDASAVARAALKACISEYNLIINENKDVNFLKSLFDFSFNVINGTENIEGFDVKYLLKAMSFSHKELEDLIDTSFIRQGDGNLIYISMEKKDPESVQNDVERIQNLTLCSLDRIHRFVRLWRHLPWSIKELDIVLSSLNDPSIIDKDIVDKLAIILYIQESLNLSAEEICASWSDLYIPSGSPEKRDSLFDRLFNLPPFMELYGSLPKNEEFIHPSFKSDGSAPKDNALYRLRAGLNADDEKLYQLIVYLQKPLGLDLYANDPEKKKLGFDLSVKNLTLLYRHILLARQLNLSIPDLFRIIRYTGISEEYVKSLDDLSKLIEFYNWQKTSGYELDDLDYITEMGIPGSSTYLKESDVVNKILGEVKAKKPLDFADTTFAFIEKITEGQSRDIIKTNINYFDIINRERETYRLSKIFNSKTALMVPNGTNIGGTDEEKKEKLKSVLIKYHATELIPSILSTLLDLTVEKIKALIAMIGMDLNSPEFTLALQVEPGTSSESLKMLKDLVHEILPLSVLFHKDIYDPKALEFIQKNKSIFSINDFRQISIQSVQKLSVYTSLADTSKEERTSAKEPGFKPNDVLKALLAMYKYQLAPHKHPPAKLNGSDIEMLEWLAKALAMALRAEFEFVFTFLVNIDLPATAPEALQKLALCVELSKYLGVEGETLRLIASETYEELSLASDAMLGAFRAKYPDDKEWNEKIAPFDDKIRSLKRDALVAYLTSYIHPEFESLNDLYYYFLVDPGLEGCASTSRVVAAISSVQLYVHRVLINLEQDNLPSDDPNHVHVLPGSINSGEWSWRKNYRVWEANRKVFLFPENYIEPELRSDKTPLFEELESTLLQQEINEQNVLDAYACYMKGFEEISNLKIAGSYHDRYYEYIEASNSYTLKKDILHLFGVTLGDPIVYYYRTVDNPKKFFMYVCPGIIWSPWRKIDVQIPAGKIAPIVYRNRLYVFWIEINTSPKNSVKTGTSEFTGYKHRISLKYTLMNLDGTWAPPQKVSLILPAFKGNDIVINDDLIGKYVNIWGVDFLVSYFNKYNYDVTYAIPPEPIDNYALDGFLWNQVYPEVVDNNIVKMNLIGPMIYENGINGEIDFYTKTIIEPKFSMYDVDYPNVLYLKKNEPMLASSSAYYELYCLNKITGLKGGEYTYRSLCLNIERLPSYWQPWSVMQKLIFSVMPSNKLAAIENIDELSIINGSPEDCIIDVHGDLLLLQKIPRLIYPNHVLKRLGTKLNEDISRILFTDGIDKLLSSIMQASLGEIYLPIGIFADQIIPDNGKIGKIDFEGPMGIYYWEIFFHISFLIANSLHSQQQFSAAQRWYNYIFNPTADEITTLPSDRNWQYIKFRGLGWPRLREILTDKNAIEVYKSNPFDPHAIARLRLSAYQKSIIMKYIDNLLDWGDSLFSEFTMESVNEATLLYAMAADILGERPVQLGSCGEGKISPKDYENIKPLIEKGSEFLIEIETLTLGENFVQLDLKKKPKGTYTDFDNLIGAMHDIDWSNAATSRMVPAHHINVTNSEERAINATDTYESMQEVDEASGGIFRGFDWKKTYTSSWQTSRAGDWSKDRFKQIVDYRSPLIQDSDLIADFAKSYLQQATISPVFCVPMNMQLMEYWDRVEDRLDKIHNCKDILGIKRELSLFSPELDPMLLVRAKAAGLSLEDVLNSISGNLPPYRFAYLIEKAKSYVSTMQGFGSTLLSAIEKKDIEELNRLRTIHEKNIQKLTTRMKEWEIRTESEIISSLEKEQESIQYRKDYYQSLIDQNLTPWESSEQSATHTSSILRVGGLALDIGAALTYLLPQQGSPFAMKYGGLELGNSGTTWSNVLDMAARITDSNASSASIGGRFDRRKQEWSHSVKLADHELNLIEKKIAAATIKKDLAERSLELHAKTIEQTDEIYDYYADKFSNLGLYTWLSSTLLRLYREAYDSAYSMARLAEQAYRFERDENEVFLKANYWEASKSGLLAGESLMIDLENMERRFIETNYRNQEVEQSFSMEEIDPAALIRLKEDGEADFIIPEICFDLFYPGQYKRIIKAVRITIPCVTGPYTNVGATLTLTGSEIRKEPKVDASLISVPLRRSMSIATSRAQYDVGVFEFSFRDERYMPFEGAGAVNSKWHLSFPKNFRQFDYKTISDVIIHISYTAENDETFRTTVENATEGLQKELSEQTFLRIFSLKHDFPGEFHQLMNSPMGTRVNIEIKNKHFPFLLQSFLKANNVEVIKALLILEVAKGQNANDVEISIDGTKKSKFEKIKPFDFGDILSEDIKANFTKMINDKGVTKSDVINLDTHEFEVEKAGDLSSGFNAVSTFDPEKLFDMMLYIEYKIDTKK